MNVLLAQLDTFIAPEVEPLPSPPITDALLYESTWLLPGAVALLAIAALVVMRRNKGAAKLAIPAFLVLLLAAAGAWFLNTNVTTERETLAERTNQLVDAAVAADIARLRDMLAADAIVEVPQASIIARRIPVSILLSSDFISSQLGRLGGLTDHGVQEVTAAIDGPASARSQTSIWAQPQGQGKTGSIWRIDWRKDTDGDWKAKRIEALWIQGFGSN